MTAGTFTGQVAESRSYNSQGQPLQIAATGLLSLDYGYESGANNGNVVRQTIAIPNGTTWHQYYGYDRLNRLSLVSEFAAPQTAPGCDNGNRLWCESYSYDRWGNRTVSVHATSGYATEPSAFDTSNRMTTGQMGGSFQYDSRGNVTRDPVVGGTSGSYAYDGESRLIAYCPQSATCTTGTSGATVYTYNGEGRRVQKSGPGGAVRYVYDAQPGSVGSRVRASPGDLGCSVSDGRPSGEHAADHEWEWGCGGAAGLLSLRRAN